MESTETTRRELSEIEARLERLTAETRRAEGQRDSLVRKLTDNEAAHDRRVVGVR
jgi:hypothetical protein